MRRSARRGGSIWSAALGALPAGLVLAASPALGESIWVLPGNGNWTTPSNWSPAGEPTAASQVRVDNGGEAQVTFPGAAAAGLTIGGAAGSSGSIAVTSGGTLSTTSATPSIVGGSGAGTLTITRLGSSWTNAGGLIIGDAAGSSGSMIVDMGATVATGSAAGSTTIISNQAGSAGSLSIDGDGSIVTVGNTLILGNAGAASLRVSSGGVLTDAGVVIGASAGGSGTAAVTGTGSLWTTTGDLTLGRSGSASLTVEAGGSAAAENAIAGLESSGSAAIKVSGAGSSLAATGELTLGASGSGELTVEAGGAVSASAITLGADEGGSGSAKVTGADSLLSATDAGGLVLGASGDGELVVESGGSATAPTITLGADAAGAGSLLVTGANSSLGAQTLVIGDEGTGSATVEAGGFMQSAQTTVGAEAGATGALTVNGAGSTAVTQNALTIGADGTGSLTISGSGAVATGTLAAGAGASGTGSIAISGEGSTLAATGAATIGGSGSGDLTISLGATMSAGSTVIGAEAAGDGTVLVTDNGSALAAGTALTVGAAGTGALTLVNGGTASAGTLSVGSASTGIGTVVVSNLGSQLAVDGAAVIGDAGNGTLTVSSSGTMTSGDAVIGASAGSIGAATVTGSGSDWTAGALTIGGAGSGSLQVTAAGTLESGAATIGSEAGSSGSVAVDGGGSVWTVDGDVTIGDAGTGSLQVTAAGEVASEAVTIGAASGSSGAVTIDGDGSVLSAAGDVVIGAAGAGTVLVTAGGTLNAAGGITLASEAGSSGVLQIGDGAGSGSVTASAITGGAGTATVIFDHTDLGYTFTPPITGTASVQQIGSGTTILASANNYTGATTIEAGTLQAGAANVLSTASAATIGAGGTLALAGTDQTVPSIVNAGTVSTLGSSAGAELTVTGDYAGSGGTLVLGAKLGNDASPTDRLVVEGDVSGTTSVSVTNLGGTGAPTTGDGIEVIAVGGASPAGGFSGNRIVAGAWDYRLYQGGVGADADDGNWYLRSDLSLAAQTYAAWPATLVNFGIASIGTYRQRTGVWSYGAAGVTVGDAWVRGFGRGGSASPAGGTPFDQSLGFGQTGVEAELPVALAAPGELKAGVMATFGRSTADVSATTHGIAGSGTVDTGAFGIGGNVTWTGSGGDLDGVYVDTVGQITWYDTDFGASDAGSLASTSAVGGAISVEVGKWIEVAKGFAIVPQTQLAYIATSAGGFTDRDGALVDGISASGFVGRTGIRAEHSRFLGSGPDDAMRLDAYLLANLAYAFGGSYAVSVGGTALDQDSAPLLGELGMGATLQMTAAAALYGEASYAATFSGGADYWSGNLGLKLDW